jgi:hypothetical protein
MRDDCTEDYICPLHRHPEADLVRVPGPAEECPNHT